MTAVAQISRVAIDLELYHSMIEKGVFHEDAKIELIHGELAKKMTIGKRHIRCVDELNMHFAALGRKRVIVSVQNPVQIDDYNEPEPDVALLRPDRDTQERPAPADVLLIIEVAESSILYDRQVKLPLYAKAGIPETWLVDLNHDAVFVHRESIDGEYGSIQRHAGADVLAPIAFPDHTITVHDLLR